MPNTKNFMNIFIPFLHNSIHIISSSNLFKALIDKTYFNVWWWFTKKLSVSFKKGNIKGIIAISQQLEIVCYWHCQSNKFCRPRTISTILYDYCIFNRKAYINHSIFDHKIACLKIYKNQRNRAKKQD